MIDTRVPRLKAANLRASTSETAQCARKSVGVCVRGTGRTSRPGWKGFMQLQLRERLPVRYGTTKVCTKYL